MKQSYVLDVVVKKLELISNLHIRPEDVMVEFNWNDISLPITASRINTTEFVPNRSIELSNISNALEDGEFKVTVFRTSADAGKSDIIGECYCEWPAVLGREWGPDEPYEHTCDIFRYEEYVGTISVNMLLMRKCNEFKDPTATRMPLTDQSGKLAVFKDINNSINPHDVFFVVGDNTPPEAGRNLLQSCKGDERCRVPHDHTRYRLVNGRVVKDCSMLPTCIHDDCCDNANLLDEFAELFKRKDASYCTASSSGDSKYCAPSRMTRKFDDSCESTDRSSCESTEASCSTLIENDLNHAKYQCSDTNSSSCSTYPPPKFRAKNMNMQESSCSAFPDTSSCSRTSASRTDWQAKHRFASSGSPTNIHTMVNKVLKMAEKCKKENEPPRVCSAPKLVKSDFQVLPRSCPVCCEDMSWMQPHTPCPKCGFLLKVGLPVEATAYDENQTAADILEKWNNEVEKFKRKKDINPLGVCLCTATKECINCQLRHSKQKPIKEMAANIINHMHVQKGVDDIIETEKSKAATCQKTMVNHIVEEVLALPISRPTMDIGKLLGSQKSEPDMAKALKWIRNQFPKRKTLLGSVTSISERSRTSLLERLKVTSDAEESGNERIEKVKHRKSTYKDKRSKQSKRSKGDIELQHFTKKLSEQYKNKAKYPPNVFGHSLCKPGFRRVPKNMGWHWNISIDKSRLGWQPGAIRRTTHIIMNYFKQKKEEMEAQILQQQILEEERKRWKPKPLQMPRLNITKENGKYKVTLQPLYDPNIPPSLMPTSMKPVTFEITKADASLRRQQIKQCFKFVDYLKNQCNQTGECGKENDQFREAMLNLNELLKKENLRDIFESSTQSESSLDIEFGGGDIVQTRVSKTDVCVQIDSDLDKPVLPPSSTELYYRNPWDGVCRGPFDKAPTDASLKPHRLEPVALLQPGRRKQRPLITKPKPKEPAQRKPKRPSSGSQQEAADKRKTGFFGKNKQPGLNIGPDGDARGKPNFGKPDKTEMSEKLQKPEKTEQAEKSEKPVRPIKPRRSKTETGPGHTKPSRKKPVISVPKPKTRPPRADKSEKEKSTRPKRTPRPPPTAVQLDIMRRKAMTRPEKLVPIIYDPALFKPRKIESCVYEEDGCKTLPLTEVAFKAHC